MKIKTTRQVRNFKQNAIGRLIKLNKNSVNSLFEIQLFHYSQSVNNAINIKNEFISAGISPYRCELCEQLGEVVRRM